MCAALVESQTRTYTLHVQHAAREKAGAAALLFKLTEARSRSGIGKEKRIFEQPRPKLGHCAARTHFLFNPPEAAATLSQNARCRVLGVENP